MLVHMHVHSVFSRRWAAHALHPTHCTPHTAAAHVPWLSPLQVGGERLRQPLEWDAATQEWGDATQPAAHLLEAMAEH